MWPNLSEPSWQSYYMHCSADFLAHQTAGLLRHQASINDHKISYQTKAHGNVLLQVLTMMQQALCVVKGFPYVADKARVLEMLASMREEPSTMLRAQPEDQDDFGHHISWQRVVNYLKTINRDDVHMHIPFATEP